MVEETIEKNNTVKSKPYVNKGTYIKWQLCLRKIIDEENDHVVTKT